MFRLLGSTLLFQAASSRPAFREEAGRELAGGKKEQVQVIDKIKTVESSLKEDLAQPQRAGRIRARSG